MTTKRRGICPVCDREYDITRDGGMRLHAYLGSRRDHCSGSGQPPKPVTDTAANLTEAEDRGYRRAVQVLRDEAAEFASEEGRDHYSFRFAADFLEAAAAPRNEGAQT